MLLLNEGMQGINHMYVQDAWHACTQCPSTFQPAGWQSSICPQHAGTAVAWVANVVGM